jgi:DNA-binding protein YbaB
MHSTGRELSGDYGTKLREGNHMSDTQNSLETSNVTDAPHLDGVGLSLEDVRLLIAQKHSIVLRPDDPELMFVTICNAFLNEIAKLHERHSKGMGRIMAEKTDEYVQGVQNQMDNLAQSLSSASVEGIRQVFDSHAAMLNVFKGQMTILALIVGISAAANVLGFILMGKV